MITDDCSRGALSLQKESSDPFSGKPWAIAALAYVTAYGWFAVIALPLEIYEYIRAYHVEPPFPL